MFVIWLIITYAKTVSLDCGIILLVLKNICITLREYVLSVVIIIDECKNMIILDGNED